MSKDKEAMKIAESSRETQKHDGFIADLFMGKADFYPLRDNWWGYASAGSPEEFEEWFSWTEKFVEFLKNRVDPDQIDSTGFIPEEVMEELRKMGAFGIKIPKEYGGLGFSQSQYRELATLFGSRCGNLSALLSAHNSLGATLPLMKYGTDEQKKRFLPRLAKGAISAFALTEKNVGSDPSSMETCAKRIYQKEKVIGYEITGEKIYTTNAMTADRKKLAEIIVVVARIVDDPSEIKNPESKICYGLFLVESNMAGYEVPKRLHFMGLRAIYNGITKYDGVMVPKENLIGKEGEGFRIALEILTIGRLTVPSICVGALKQTWRMTKYWAKERVQWGKPLGEHELMSKKLVDIAAKTFVLEAMTRYCANRVDKQRDVRLESAASKVIGTEYLWDSVNDLLQLRAGRGYQTAQSLKDMEEIPMPVERMLRDCRINLIFEGTNEMMRLWMAREGMDEYKKHFEQIKIPDGGGGVKWNPETTFKEKCTATKWIVKKIFKQGMGISKGRVPDSRLEKYFRFIRKEAKQLAKDITLISLHYQAKLEKKQLVLAAFVNRALTLFEMAVAATFSINMRGLWVELADYFCHQKMESLYPPNFRRWAKKGSHLKVYKLAKRLMEEDTDFLEYGIIRVPLEAKSENQTKTAH